MNKYLLSLYLFGKALAWDYTNDDYDLHDNIYDGWDHKDIGYGGSYSGHNIHDTKRGHGGHDENKYNKHSNLYGNNKNRLIKLFGRGPGRKKQEDYPKHTFDYPSFHYSGYPGYQPEGRDYYDHDVNFKIPSLPEFESKKKESKPHQPVFSGYGQGYGGYGGYGSLGLFLGDKNKADNKHTTVYGGAESNADKHSKAEIEVDETKYRDQAAYAGDSVYTDEAGYKKGFVKGELYENGGYEGYDKNQDYKGNQLTQNKDLSTNAKVAYEVDHSSKFRNNFKDENHRGSYKGDEFDVAYKTSDVQGGYTADEVSNKAKAAAYNGGQWNEERANAGKFNEAEYYGDNEDEKKSRAHQFGYGPVSGTNKYGIPTGSKYDDTERPAVDLYGKFKGDGKTSGPGYGSGLSSGYGHGHFHDKEKKENDLYKNDYGAEYASDDKYKKKFDDEAYAGVEEEASFKKQWDQGNYRDVEAKGHNKVATYEGDYNNNKQEHDTVYQVGHYEDLQTDFDTKANVDEYQAKYDGSDYKGGFDADKKFGQYTDKEYAREMDKNAKVKAYEGAHQDQGYEKDVEAKLYAKQAGAYGKHQGIERYPAPKYYYGGDNNKHPHERQRRGYYGNDYEPRNAYGYGY